MFDKQFPIPISLGIDVIHSEHHGLQTNYHQYSNPELNHIAALGYQ